MIPSPFGPYLFAPGNSWPVNFVGTATAAGTTDIVVPAGVIANDLLVCICVYTGSAATTPAGWTLAEMATLATESYAIFYKVADGTEASASVEFNGNANGVWLHSLLVYRNARIASPLANISVAEIGSGAARSFTTGANGSDMGVAFAMSVNPNVQAYTAPAAMTLRVSETGGSARQYIADGVGVPSGTFAGTPAEATVVGGFTVLAL